MAAIQFINAAVNSTASGTSLAVNKPTNTQQGDVMLAHIVVENNSDIENSTPAGWSLVLTATVGTRAIRHYIFSKVAGASEPANYTWGFSTTTEVVGQIVTYRGVKISPAVGIGNIASSTGTSSSQSVTAPAITIQTAGNWAVHFGCSAYGTTFTPSASPLYVERADTRSGSLSTNIAAEISDMADCPAGPTGIVTATSASADYRVASHVELIAARVEAAGGIATGAVFGTAKLVGKVLAVGAIASAMAFGTARLQQTVFPWGNIESAEAIGQSRLKGRVLSAGGIVSAESLGSAQFSSPLMIISSCGAIATGEGIGTPRVSGKMCGGIRSAEAFGTPIVLKKSIIQSAGGIASGEQFGTGFVTDARIIAQGIASAEAVGGHLIQGVVHSAGGITTAYASGDAVVHAKSWKLCGAIPSAEAFGSPEVVVGVANIREAGGMASLAAVGTPAVSGPIRPSSIQSLEGFGIQWVYEENFCGNITSGEAFGSATLVAKSPSTIWNIPGIASSALVNSPRVVGGISSSVIATGYASGTPIIRGHIHPSGIPGIAFYGFAKLDGIIKPGGIASSESFGLSKVNAAIPGSITGAGGIPSEESLGSPMLEKKLLALSIASAEAFGTPVVQKGKLRPSAISGEEAFGTAKLSTDIRGISGIPSSESFGANPTVRVPVYRLYEIVLESRFRTSIQLYSKRRKEIVFESQRK